MTRLSLPRWTPAAAGLAIVALVVAGATAQQQQREQREGRTTERSTSAQSQSLTIPGDGDLIELSVDAPAEVRVGDSYDYKINVRNASSDVMLHDVVIQQQPHEGFQIEKARLAPAQASRSGQQGQQPGQRQNPNEIQQGAQAGQDQAAQQQEQQQAQQEQQRQQQEQQAQAEQQAQQGSQNEWTIDQLPPGETRTIEVTASSDAEGASGVCVAVKSYLPSLCLQTKFVKPELKLVKRVPKEANLCQPLEYEYYITNEGTGDTGQLTIKDALDEGVQTITGDQELQFDVDNLAAGDTRKFVATLQATKPGSYSTRATVDSEKGGKARSNSVTTEVRAAELAIALEGPEVEYANRPVTYTARVTNTGNVDARNVRLALFAADGVSVANVSEPRPSTNAVSADSGQGSQPTAAVRTAAAEGSETEPRGVRQASATNGNRANQDQQATNEVGSWDLGNLPKGETREVRYTVRPRGLKVIHQRAVAQYVCAPTEDDRRAVEAVATTQTEIISLPALHISTTDEVDPVKVGEEAVYTIVVENQGTAPDEQIELTAELPEQLEFASLEGDTEGTNEGQQVTFAPVERLEPGKRVMWTLRTKVKQPGEIELKVGLKSKNQEEVAETEEPTRLFSEEDAAQQSRDARSDRESQQQQQREQQQRQQEQQEEEPAETPAATENQPTEEPSAQEEASEEPEFPTEGNPRPGEEPQTPEDE